MWRHRLRWYLQARVRRNQGWNQVNKLPGIGIIAVCLFVLIAGYTLLKTIWNIFMNGFLQATPWVAGSQVGTYYWNSAGFALKCTLTIGIIMFVVMFLLGAKLSRIFHR